MWFDPLRAVLLQITLAGCAAVVSRRAKPVAIALGLVGVFGAPWLAGSHPLARGGTTLLGFIGLIRIIDVVRTREPWTEWRRLLHVESFVDSRTLQRAPMRLDALAFGLALLWGGAAWVGLRVAQSPMLAVRWAGGAVFTYTVIEAGYAVAGAVYRGLGFIAPPLHVVPVASLSIAELWGKRWAIPVSVWLRENCYLPLARRGRPRLGLLFGFVASGVGHAYPIFVAVGLRMAGWMVAFFVVQGIAVVVEARLGVTRWPRLARRGWTVAIMVASSPLFVEPALRVLL